MLGMCYDLKMECPLMANVLINCFLAGGIILGGCEILEGPAGRNRFLGVGLQVIAYSGPSSCHILLSHLLSYGHTPTT